MVSPPQPLTTNALAAGSQSAAGHSLAPRFSGDGRYVAFVSRAPNLVTNDDLAPHLDLFIHDLTSGQNVLVSVNTNGVGGGNQDANYPSLSANGRLVAFASAASNLTPGDTNHGSDIFVRDLDAGTIVRVSESLSGYDQPPTPSRWKPSAYPQLSSDGRWVLFQCEQVAGFYVARSADQIYRHDLQSNQTTLVSVKRWYWNSNDVGADDHSRQASMTPDGLLVVFATMATDLFDDLGPRMDTEIARRSFVASSQGSIPLWISSTVSAYYPTNLFDYACFHPVMSTNGQRIAFLVGRSQYSGWPRFAPPVSLFYRNLDSASTILVATNLQTPTWPCLSEDGRWLAYEDGTNVHVWDADTGSNILVNVNQAGTGPGNAAARSPVLSVDGTKVAFLSAATDLTPAATNGITQVFLRDLAAPTTHLISARPDGSASACDHETAAVSLSPDGRHVAFDSPASDLVPNDGNEASDVFVRDRVTGMTRLISVRHSTLPQVTGRNSPRAEPGSLSADGRHLAYRSDDTRSFPGDTNRWHDVFLHDLVLDAATPLNVAPNGVFAADSAAGSPVISSNGQFVAYRTLHGLLDDFASSHAFWIDLHAGDRRPVDVDTNGLMIGLVQAAVLSPDGRCVVFQSQAAAGNFVPALSDDTSSLSIFLRDMVAGTNQLVSINAAGNGRASTWPGAMAFSPDGRWLLFRSSAASVVTNAPSSCPGGLYARDLAVGTTHLIPASSLSAASNSALSQVGFSGNSRRIAFVRIAEDTWCGLWQAVGVHDLETGAQQTMTVGTQAPALSGNGRWLACEIQSCSTWQPTNILLVDLETGATNLVASSLVPTNAPLPMWRFTTPLVTANGRHVVFLFEQTVPEETLTDWPVLGMSSDWTRRIANLYVYDRLHDKTLLLTPNPATGQPGNGRTTNPMLSADGTTLVFHSFANDLAPGDYNERRDLFVVRFESGDTDGDSLDDDWELIYFDTLDRDGSGDFDQDGARDREELLAGTDPTNRGSVLRTLTVTAPGSGSTTVLWSAVPGRTYRVQFKDGLESGLWTGLPELVTATTTTGSAVDRTATAAGQRFYRVVLEP